VGILVLRLSLAGPGRDVAAAAAEGDPSADAASVPAAACSRSCANRRHWATTRTSLQAHFVPEGRLPKAASSATSPRLCSARMPGSPTWALPETQRVGEVLACPRPRTTLSTPPPPPPRTPRRRSSCGTRPSEEPCITRLRLCQRRLVDDRLPRVPLLDYSPLSLEGGPSRVGTGIEPGPIFGVQTTGPAYGGKVGSAARVALTRR